MCCSLEQDRDVSAESAAPSPLSESSEVDVSEPESVAAKKARLREEQRQKRKAVSDTEPEINWCQSKVIFVWMFLN